MSIAIITNLGDSPVEIISKGGEFLSISLIIILSILLSALGTKYWNDLNIKTLNICSRIMLLIFVAIVIFRIGILVI